MACFSTLGECLEFCKIIENHKSILETISIMNERIYFPRAKNVLRNCAHDTWVRAVLDTAFAHSGYTDAEIIQLYKPFATLQLKKCIEYAIKYNRFSCIQEWVKDWKPIDEDSHHPFCDSFILVSAAQLARYNVIDFILEYVNSNKEFFRPKSVRFIIDTMLSNLVNPHPDRDLQGSQHIKTLLKLLRVRNDIISNESDLQGKSLQLLNDMDSNESDSLDSPSLSMLLETLAIHNDLITIQFLLGPCQQIGLVEADLDYTRLLWGACKTSSIPVLEWSFAHHSSLWTDENIREMIKTAARDDQLKVLKWLVATVPKDWPTIFKVVFRQCLDVFSQKNEPYLVWMYMIEVIFHFDFMYAIKKKNIVEYQFLLDTFVNTKDHKHEDFVDWLASCIEFEKIDVQDPLSVEHQIVSSALYSAAQAGTIDTIQNIKYLYGDVLDSNVWELVAMYAAKHNSVQVLDLIDNSITYNKKDFYAAVMKYAATSGHYDLVESYYVRYCTQFGSHVQLVMDIYHYANSGKIEEWCKRQLTHDQQEVLIPNLFFR